MTINTSRNDKLHHKPYILTFFISEKRSNCIRAIKKSEVLQKNENTG